MFESESGLRRFFEYWIGQDSVFFDVRFEVSDLVVPYIQFVPQHFAYRLTTPRITATSCLTTLVEQERHLWHRVFLDIQVKYQMD